MLVFIFVPSMFKHQGTRVVTGEPIFINLFPKSDIPNLYKVQYLKFFLFSTLKLTVVCYVFLCPLTNNVQYCFRRFLGSELIFSLARRTGHNFSTPSNESELVTKYWWVSKQNFYRKSLSITKTTKFRKILCPFKIYMYVQAQTSTELQKRPTFFISH
jgi:hypothetical protein